MQPLSDINDRPAGICPVDHAVPSGLQAADELVLAMPRRMVVQYATTDDGRPELFLYYGDKEVSFDEPDLFAFGETLARQTRFRADAVLGWGKDYSWPRMRELLEGLVDAGILESAGSATEPTVLGYARPSPLPPSIASGPRNWADCARITSELTGRAVDPGHLELIVPMFRVAHIALDADGRQVGEANVFPRPLRLDTPTEWKACPFPGTRYLADRPMNTSALKAMRAHWPQMMAALKFIRARFLERFPAAAQGWTVAHTERLAALVLAVPTYQLVRAGAAAAPLHPALSSLFRVTDGLRMATHQMMFVPVGEPVVSPEQPITAEAIFDYAERNYSFHSETGVCAGPSHMVREFLAAVLGGAEDRDFVFDPEVRAALDDCDAAFDYGLFGLRVHCALFPFWPAMARCYEQLATIADAAARSGDAAFAPVQARFALHRDTMQRATLLGTEERRQNRELAYAAIFDQCGQGLGDAGPRLGDRFFAARADAPAGVADALLESLAAQLGDTTFTRQFAAAIAQFAETARTIIAVADACQAEVNAAAGRLAAQRPFTAADIAVHARLVGDMSDRLPFLFEELAATFGITLAIDGRDIELTTAPQFSQFGGPSADYRAVAPTSGDHP